MRPNIAAVVLCGGESRRMGRNKAWMPFGDEFLLQRVIRLIGTAVRMIVVVGAPDQDLPELPIDVTIVHDAVAGRGPLQGLAAGLAAVPDSIELVYATATDVPFLEPRWIGRLVELSDRHDLVIPLVDGHHHPLAALYRPRAVLPAIDSLLREDRLRLTLLIELLQTRVVNEGELRSIDPALSTLRNLNAPSDYQQALREAGLTHDAGIDD